MEQNNITTTRITVKPEARRTFFDWQAKLNGLIGSFDGFVSLEFLSPQDKIDEWVITIRFKDEKGVKHWRHSSICQEMFKELKSLVREKELVTTVGSVSDMRSGITEVIVTQVAPGTEEEYRKWSGKIHEVEAKFPGFKGVYVQSPASTKGGNWITLLQFDSQENLDRWLNSAERKAVLEESTSLITSLESHRVISPYGGWFSSIAKAGAVPAVWKQTMVVLLVLFPIIMFEIKFLNPHIGNLGPSLSTFIGNAISVTLLAYPAMPFAIKCLRWWLVPTSPRKSISTLGALLVIALYLFEIAIFWNFV